MSNPSGEAEPTMEEILASIRKIISDDEPEGEASAESEPPADNVLELTERVEEDKAEEAAPGLTEEQEIDAILASVTKEVEMGEKEPKHEAAGGGEIVSQRTDIGVTSSLAGFAGALAADRRSDEPAPGSNQTLDRLVREALEPYLRGWLDEHLEPLVERLVKEELKRMARRAEDV